MKTAIIAIAKAAFKDSVQEGVITARNGSKYEVKLTAGGIIKNGVVLNNESYNVDDRVLLGLIDGKTNRMRIIGKAQGKRINPTTVVYL